MGSRDGKGVALTYLKGRNLTQYGAKLASGFQNPREI